MQEGLTSSRERALRAEPRAGPAGTGCMHKQHWDVAMQSCSTGLKDIQSTTMAVLSYTCRLTCTSAWNSGR